jgi:Co/Zn/Cd efflux system component
MSTAAAQTDKVAHFGVGFIAGSASSSLALTNSNGRHEWAKSVSVGFGVSALIGTGKELYDWADYGVFNWADLGATVLGGALGGVSVKIAINRYEKKHLL